MLVLALAFMIAFTFLAFQVIIWQSQDISVDIVSDTEEGSNEVTISVKNTAGAVLLFHENNEMTGKIEYLSNDGWVEYCDVYYTQGNATAISQQYNGTFAELEPGEDWVITVPKEKVASMKNGTYRIKLAYVTENKYKEYLSDLNDESIDGSIDVSDDESISIFEESVVIEESLNENPADESETSLDEESENLLEEADEEYHASSISELYIKTFEYEVPTDFVSAISFDESNIKGSDAVFEPYFQKKLTTEDALY